MTKRNFFENEGQKEEFKNTLKEVVKNDKNITTYIPCKVQMALVFVFLTTTIVSIFL